MQDVAFTLLFAGHDTSAAALTMMLRYLKLEPRVLQQLRNEQLQVQHAVVSLPKESASNCFIGYACAYGHVDRKQQQTGE